MSVLFAVRNNLVERRRLTVQREEENDKVLRSVSLNTCKVFRGKRRDLPGVTRPGGRAGHADTYEGGKEEVGAWGQF